MRKNILSLFRKIGLMHGINYLLYLYLKFKYSNTNKSFKANHVDVKLPPDYMMFEAFQPNYHKYFYGGKEVATNFITKLKSYYYKSDMVVLDWGCGPARLTRHLPSLLSKNSQVYGSDYNPKTIDWCSKNIEGVRFSKNNLEPPLNYSNDTFDFIISLSIFTHLSESNHKLWVKELHRVLKPQGLALITTAGQIFIEKMTSAEQEKFNVGELVVRGNAIEGHRVYGAFQPKDFMLSLFQNQFEVVEHTEGKRASWGFEQDIWVVRKK